MVDFIQILMILAELVSIILIVFALGLAFTVWKDNRNPIDLGAFFLFLSVAITISYTGIRDSIINLGFQEEGYVLFYIGALGFGHFMTIFIASLFLWFLLYLTGLKKLYSLPLVVGFYFAAYGIITGEVDPVLSFITWAILSSMVILFINAIKNKHGLSFTLAIMAISSVLIAIVEPGTVWSYAIKWFTGINIILGENGWWDDHVFYDRAKRKKIQNVWIARMTTIDK